MPFAEKLSGQKAVTYTDLVLGIVVVIWALAGYCFMGEMEPQGIVTTRS